MADPLRAGLVADGSLDNQGRHFDSITSVAGKDGKSVELEFEPRTGDAMQVACLWATTLSTISTAAPRSPMIQSRKSRLLAEAV